MQKSGDWLRAHEARRMLGGSSCELMHLREAGKLQYQKLGNAFLYASEDVQREAMQRKRTGKSGQQSEKGSKSPLDHSVARE